jgi:hypothetical protein
MERLANDGLEDTARVISEGSDKALSTNVWTGQQARLLAFSLFNEREMMSSAFAAS